MADTAIEWTEKVWNPTTGCDRVSPGCDHCYAMTMAKRLKGMGSAKYQTDGDPRTSGPGFGVATHEDALTLPRRWKKPRRIFVNSMSDLFHKDVPDEFIARVFVTMARCPQHTFQILTKRPARMRSLLSSPEFVELVVSGGMLAPNSMRVTNKQLAERWISNGRWPLRNVWLGTSVESQQWANIRIPALLGTPAAVRWLSCEPLLGPVNLGVAVPVGAFDTREPMVRWVVVGGESGRGARPMHPDWARSLRDQCAFAEIPFLFKQTGSVLARELGLAGKGHEFDALPAEFQIREYPERAA